MPYVDGFVIPVPRKKVKQYKAIAAKAGKIWIELGALAYRECQADDVKPGKWTSFPQSVKLKKDETVIFSYIVFKNRKDRDRINKAVMADPRLADMMQAKDMPFDASTADQKFLHRVRQHPRQELLIESGTRFKYLPVPSWFPKCVAQASAMSRAFRKPGTGRMIYGGFTTLVDL